MLPEHALRKLALKRQPFYKVVERVASDGCSDLVKAALDTALMATSALWAWSLAFGQLAHPGRPWAFVLAVLIVRLPLYYLFRLHRVSWRSISRYNVIGLTLSAAAGMPLILLCEALFPGPSQIARLPRPALFLMSEAGCYLLLLGSARITARALHGSLLARGGRRTIVVGAGKVGRAIASQLREAASEFTPIGFVDDDPRSHGRRVGGLPVFDSLASLRDIVERFAVQQVIVAIPTLSSDKLRDVLAACEKTGVPARIVPPVTEWIGRHPALREVRMEDLLPQTRRSRWTPS